MKENKGSRRLLSLQLHPFLMGAYSVLALLSANIEEIEAAVAVRAFIVALLFSGLLFGILRLLVKDTRRAALLATVLLALFFSYGHVYGFLEQQIIFGLALGRHRFLAGIWLGLAGLSLYTILRRRRAPDPSLTSNLNVLSLALLVFPLLTLGQWGWRSLQAGPAQAAPESALKLHPPQASPLPDIYYIILDAYSRDDVLKGFYNLDNTAFLNDLEDLGFYVARCSQSNYAQTQLSLASTLNFNYVQELDERFSPANPSRVGLEEFIRHSAVRQALEGLGYQTVAFETGYKFSQLEDAAQYLSPQATAMDRAQLSGGLNDFEVLYLRTTAVLLAADTATLLPKSLQPALENPRRTHRERVLFALEHLERIPAEPGPKFVFAHLVIPHPPHVFGPEGDYVTFDKSESSGYQGQVTYINSRIIPILQNILAQSAQPPIIILQGDHGGVNTPPNQRTAILNAYFLPGEGARRLYENISPVNSFRVIFDQYFEAGLEPIADISYFSVYKTPFDTTVVSNQRPGCPNSATGGG